MVTWGVTDAGGRHASTRSAGADAGEATVASHASQPESRAAGTTPDAGESADEPRLPGLPPITVEPTPAGLATALSHAGAGLATTGPRRSHPAYRDDPPPFTVSDRTRVPARVRAATPDVDVTLVLPRSLSALFVAAPLAYYLPATVSAVDDATPRLFVEGQPRARFEDLADDVASLFRRIFHLDCLVRGGPSSVGGTGESGGSAGLLTDLDLDPSSLQSSTPLERLDRYLSAWDPARDDDLPDWHLSTAVEPTTEAIPCLPELLARLSLIDRPEGEPRERSELLDVTLSTAYRTRGTANSSDVLAPSTPAGRIQGWLAPGEPIEAFKPTGAAFENRRRYRDRGGDSLSVAVVLADAEMGDEHERVLDTYRECAADSSLSIDVSRAPTRATLRETFRLGHDLVHYIGHCDDAGLRCTDGNLATADLSACRAPAFFLNACGSYDEGLALVERGAVAGGVTFADVLDRDASRVGTAFARLAVAGFSVQRALQLARRRILMGQDYAVVGDGTFAPWPGERPPGVLYVESIGPESKHGQSRDRNGTTEAPAADAKPETVFGIAYEAVTVRTTGQRHPVPFGAEDLLNGDTATAILTRSELRDLLGTRSLPVVYGDDLLWSADLRERLAV